MSYEKQTWKTGDIVTSVKLNHMEDGIAESGGLPSVTSVDEGKVLTVDNLGEWAAKLGTLVVHLNNSTLDKIWQAIFDALAGGRIVCILDVDDINLSGSMDIVNKAVFDDEELKYFIYLGSDASASFMCSSANEYPVDIRGNGPGSGGED